jgi:hypothetical protein
MLPIRTFMRPFQPASIAVIAAMLAGPLLAGPAFADTSTGTMNGAEIREMVTRNRIYLATPLGGEFPLNYRPNGVVDGTGEAAGLGRFARPKDSGRWWIAGDQLCQKWQSWYDGKRMCFVIERSGANRFIWRQDNGDTGRGRFAAR